MILIEGSWGLVPLPHLPRKTSLGPRAYRPRRIIVPPSLHDFSVRRVHPEAPLLRVSTLRGYSGIPESSCHAVPPNGAAHLATRPRAGPTLAVFEPRILGFGYPTLRLICIPNGSILRCTPTLFPFIQGGGVLLGAALRLDLIASLQATLPLLLVGTPPTRRQLLFGAERCPTCVQVCGFGVLLHG